MLDAALEALGGSEKSSAENAANGGFFREDVAGRLDGSKGVAIPRAVLVDMEAKVVAGTRARRARRASRGGWRYDPASCFVRDGGGCGNNWSYGYAKLGPSNGEGILEAVRHEVERCDILGGFFLAQSAAGGTGSGVGSYATSLIRDHFPSSSVLNYCVLPYTAGEVSVQAYNTVLTLAATLPDTDGSILVPNQHLMDVCTKNMRIARPSVWDVNAVAATELAAAFLPVRGSSLGGGGGLSVSPTRLLHGICGTHFFSLFSASAYVRDRRTRTFQSRENECFLRLLVRLIVSRIYVDTHNADTCVTVLCYHVFVHMRACTWTFACVEYVVVVVPPAHLCSHPLMKLLSLRAAPHMPSSSIDFTTYSWNSVMRSLETSMRMCGSGSGGSTAVHGSLSSSSAGIGASVAAPSDATWAMPASSASLLVLRGRESAVTAASVLKQAPRRSCASRAHSTTSASKASVSYAGASSVTAGDDANTTHGIADPRLYLPWTVHPLAVEHSSSRLGSHEMSAALLANCALPIPHIRDALACTYRMLDAGAYVHLYRQHGMDMAEWTEAIAAVEEAVDAYAPLHRSV